MCSLRFSRLKFANDECDDCNRIVLRLGLTSVMFTFFASEVSFFHLSSFIFQLIVVPLHANLG